MVLCVGGRNAGVKERDRVAVVGPKGVESCQKRKGLVDRQIQQLLLTDQLLSLMPCKFHQKVPKRPERQSRLHIIGAIEAIQAIGPHDSTLRAEYGLLGDIIASEPEVINNRI